MDVMSDTSRNVSAVRRLLEEVWGRGAWDLIPDLIAHDYVGHFPIGDHYGPEGVRIDVAAYRTAMPDLTVTVEELLEAGDCVVRRYALRGTLVRPLLDIPATGAVFALRALAIDRMAGGLLRESWVFGDPLPSIALACPDER